MANKLLCLWTGIKGLFCKSQNTEMIKTIIGELRNNQITPQEQLILNNFFQFIKKTVHDIMIPRADICAINIDIDPGELNNIMSSKGYARILVYENNLDNVLGFIHIKDLFKSITIKRYDLKDLIRQHIVSSHTTKLMNLLLMMQQKKTHISVVIDEYGGVSGIVTFEDIVESLVGSIEDEHDKFKNEDYHFINKNSIIASARIKIDKVEKVFGIVLMEGKHEFETISGLILDIAGYIPKKGEKFKVLDKLEVEIIEVTPRIIKEVKITYSNKR